MGTRGAYYRGGAPWTPLYTLREAAGVSQSVAAAALGISERTYRTREALPQMTVTPVIVAVFAAIATNPERFARQTMRSVADSVAIASKPEAVPAIATNPALRAFNSALEASLV